jgi:hypothetical protein
MGESGLAVLDTPSYRDKTAKGWGTRFSGESTGGGRFAGRREGAGGGVWLFVCRSGFGFKLVFDAEVAAHIAQGFFGDGEFAEVVAPNVLARGAAGVGLAVDGADGPVGHLALEALLRDLKGDEFAGFPEVRGELMREEQDVVTALVSQVFNGVVTADPFAVELAGVPLAELEAVFAGLPDEQAEEFGLCHAIAAMRLSSLRG